jgi:TonB-dependent starch-binding outer membrane protein SusC
MPKSNARQLVLLLVVLFSSVTVFSQKTISGKVQDSKGPVVGATVAVKGTSVAAVSAADGGFSLSLPKGRSVLVVSSVGYVTKEVRLQESQTSVDVSLVLGDNSLDEIVITGYSGQKKKDLTGAVAIVKTSDLTKVASPSFAQQIEGRASGVQVTTSGAAGDSLQVEVNHW